MKNLKIIVPVGLAVAGAGIAAVLLTGKKKDAAPAAKTETKSAAGKAAPQKNKKEAKVPALSKSGVYSFMSGYSDAKQVELSVNYDPETMSFDVVEEEYISYSSDSHVAIMHAEDFSLQIEYAEFYSGENFEKLSSDLKEKYASYKDVSLNCASACSYIAGDGLCLCIPTAQSYVLVSVFPAKGSKETAETLIDNAVLKAILNSITINA